MAAVLDNATLARVIREREMRRSSDPLLRAFESLTVAAGCRFGSAQRDFVLSLKRNRLLDGGNRSGKTWTNCVDFLLRARGIHDYAARELGGAAGGYVWPPQPLPEKWSGGNWVGWWGCVKYELFGQGAWKHFKRLLLYPGESVKSLPTRNIMAISWNKKNPEIPDYLQIKRVDFGRPVPGSTGLADIHIMSYDAATDAWSSAAVDDARPDEEMPADKHQELQLRIVDRGGSIAYSATALKNLDYEIELRNRAEAGDPDVFHARLSLRDNPAVPLEEIKRLERHYIDDPEEFRLRVDGYPRAEEGKIYPDSLWKPRLRVVKPFSIPSDWTKYRCIDHGVHTAACVWVAVAPGRKKIALYRNYYGFDVEPPVLGNALEILRLSRLDGGELAYAARFIDPATLGAGQETGTRLIDLWNRAGVCSRCGHSSEAIERHCEKCGGERECVDVSPAPDNRVEPGIELVKELLREMLPDQSPLLVVFDTCTEFLRERRNYGRKVQSETGDADDKKRKPVKREDHGLDCFRYLVAAGLEWVPRLKPPPREGTFGRVLWDKRVGNTDE